MNWKRFSLVQWILIEIAFVFDVTLIWYSITRSTILPLIAAVLSAIIHFPKFIQKINWRSFTKRQWLWIEFSLVFDVLLIWYGISYSDFIPFTIAVGAGILSMIFRKLFGGIN